MSSMSPAFRLPLAPLFAALLLSVAPLSVAQDADAPKKAPKATPKPAGDKPAAAKADAAKAKPAKPTSPKTLKLKREPFRVEVKLSGKLEGANMTEVKIHPKQWAMFKVLDAVEHGSAVKEGDQLIKLDLEDVDRSIKDRQRTLAEWPDWHKTQQLSIKVMEQGLSEDIAAAKRANDRAQEDLKRFLEISKPFALKDAAFTVQTAQNSLAYANEELRQLKRMYEADDLTEETEEIVLKRTEDLVKRAAFALKRAELTAARTREIALPRQEIDTKYAAQKAKFALEQALLSLPLALKKKKLEYEKGKESEAKQRQSFKELLADRKAMNFASPASGIVYYGPSNRGSFSGVAMGKASLKMGGSVKPHGVIMTIVSPGKLVARVDVPADKLQLLKPGLAGTAKVKAFAQESLAAKVTKVDGIPMGPGKFDGHIEVDPGDNAGIVAGMQADITILAYEKNDAIAVPVAAVHEEDGKKVVYVKKGDASEARVVKTGWKHNGKMEITAGLEAGTIVYLKKP